MKLPVDEVHKIAVFRALQLGDLMCAIPAVRALRHAYPSAEIVLIGLPWAASFAGRFSIYFNRFIHFPGYPGLPEQPFDQDKFENFVAQMRNESFDLVIQLQGNGTIVNPLMKLFNAKNVAGYYNDESFVDSPLFMPYPNAGHEISRHLLLMKYLDIPLKDNYLEFPFNTKDYDEYNKLFIPVQYKKYICVHPGSRGAWRQWPPKYFAALADYCIENNFTVVITGTKDESDITKELIKYMHHPVIDLTGATSLGAIALLIKNAFLLIANCTGVSHIAAATETPSIIISMDGEPERWGPVNHVMHTTINWLTCPHFEEVFKHIADKIISAAPSLEVTSTF